MKPWCCLLPLIALAVASLQGANDYAPANPEWNRPVEPFRIIGNVHYVGAAGVSSYLITTPEGHILIDSGFAETVPLIEANVAKLGFRLDDVRLLLISHAHFDHVGGMAALRAKTKARLLTSHTERRLLARGGTRDFAFGDKCAFAPVAADAEVRDGEKIVLGGTTLTAHLTPGHTKGSVTWSLEVREGEKTYHVVIAASLSAPGYQLVDNPKYPEIVSDYEASFETMRNLPCDVLLSVHAWDFGLQKKMEARMAGAPGNPFVEEGALLRFVEKAETALEKQLARQRADIASP